MKLSSEGWPTEIRMTRLGWSSVNPPYSQPGGRYWPTGDSSPEYHFDRDDDGNAQLPWEDQVIIFRMAT